MRLLLGRAKGRARSFRARTRVRSFSPPFFNGFLFLGVGGVLHSLGGHLSLALQSLEPPSPTHLRLSFPALLPINERRLRGIVVALLSFVAWLLTSLVFVRPPRSPRPPSPQTWSPSRSEPT